MQSNNYQQILDKQMFWDDISKQIYKQLCVNPFVNLTSTSPWSTSLEAIIGNAGVKSEFATETAMNAKTSGIDVTIN